jgi:hypothetical protein
MINFQIQEDIAKSPSLLLILEIGAVQPPAGVTL